MNNKLLSTVLKGIGVAMGVGVVVLNTLGTLTADTAFTLLGLGLTALAMGVLQKEGDKS